MKKKFILAEATRFELVVQDNLYDNLANCWFKPLTHASLSKNLINTKQSTPKKEEGKLNGIFCIYQLARHTFSFHKGKIVVENNFLSFGYSNFSKLDLESMNVGRMFFVSVVFEKKLYQIENFNQKRELVFVKKLKKKL